MESVKNRLKRSAHDASLRLFFHRDVQKSLRGAAKKSGGASMSQSKITSERRFKNFLLFFRSTVYFFKKA